jgi:hypothetical protein
MSRSPAVLLLVCACELFGCSTTSFPPGTPDSGEGDAGCAGAQPTCPEPCDAGFAAPECVEGSWVCPAEPAIACVVSPIDAGPSTDGGLVCGPYVCDPGTTYCQNANGGAQPLDGGSSATYTCLPLPATCDGGTPSCACVNSDGCTCSEEGGAITVVCDFP